MKSLLLAIISFVICYPVVAAGAEKAGDCWRNAKTQTDLNDCAAKSNAYSSNKTELANSELNRIYQAVQNRHKDDPVFLRKLEAAQLAWIKFRDAQIEMKYPHQKESGYYGSSFPMCLSSYLEELTRERIATLKQWLESKEGDSCAGSMR